jgi:WD40 repeat protein
VAGEIGLWALPDAAPMVIHQSGDAPIRSVAFGLARGLASPKKAADRWLLATGDTGGTVTVWDLKRQAPLNFCRGSHYDINALAFSPDGTTLASAGRAEAKVWDVATGRLLLNLKHRNSMTALAFSPDGTRLAIGSRTAFDHPGGVDVYRLEDGRGIRTFRGLRGQVPKTIFSPDGRLIAGLSQDWQVAIWVQATGQLAIKLDVPQGETADNSGLAFSPDGKRFAFSSGNRAMLWEVETGTELGVWPLPEGLADALAFRGLDQLVLLRRESADVKIPLYSAVSLDDNPRVMRLRNLLGDQPTEPIRVITDFSRFVHHAAATPDGKYFAVEGVGGPEGGARSVNAYDASTGLRLWSFASRKSLGVGAWIGFDPTGKVLSVKEYGNTILLEMPKGTTLGVLDQAPRSHGPGARRWLEVADDLAGQSALYTVHEQGRKPPLRQVVINSTTLSVVTQFSPDGRHLIWGNSEGSVSVCDLDEVKHRLDKVDLGW